MRASGSSGAPLGLLAVASRLLQPHIHQLALELVEIVGESDAVVEFEAADRLIVELEDALAQIRPEREAFLGELDDARPLVLRIRDPFDKPVTLETFQNSVEILPADNEEVGKRADGDAIGR